MTASPGELAPRAQARLEEVLRKAPATDAAVFEALLPAATMSEPLRLAMERVIDVWWVQYVAGGRVFTTRTDIAAFLETSGYQVKKSTVYKHVKDGRLRPSSSTGEFYLCDVERYAQTLRRVAGAPEDTDLSDVARQIKDLELEEKQMDVAKKKRNDEKEAGLLVSREETNLAAAIKTQLLRDGTRTDFQRRSPDLAALLGVDLSEAPRIAEWCCTIMDEHLNGYARDSGLIEVIIADGSISFRM